MKIWKKGDKITSKDMNRFEKAQPFVVNFTITEVDGSDKIVADQSLIDVLAAYKNGQTIRLIANNSIELQLKSLSHDTKEDLSEDYIRLECLYINADIKKENDKALTLIKMEWELNNLTEEETFKLDEAMADLSTLLSD